MRGNKSRIRYAWWEYVAYVFTTAGLIVVGSLALIAIAAVRLIVDMNIRKAILGIIILLLVLIGYGWWQFERDHDLGEEAVSIIIQKGDSFGLVARRLVDQHVVQSQRVLSIAARLNGVDKRLIPGRYDFSGEVSCRSVLERLKAGDFLRIRVTIPEGATLRQVASILSTRLEFDTMAVMELAGDSQFVRNLSIPCLEGYLFPETYFFPWGTDAKAAISETVRQFFSETESVWPDSIVLGLSRDEVIVLASIIEAETALDRERQLVASVYVNRLRRNMKLDADPTVVYGLGELDRPLNRRDLRQDTPYNTYLHRGLPPSAINSPGLASIRAALNPAETDYYYFVADQSGGHKFSRTNAEHNRARRRIKSQKR